MSYSTDPLPIVMLPTAIRYHVRISLSKPVTAYGLITFSHALRLQGKAEFGKIVKYYILKLLRYMISLALCFIWEEARPGVEY